MCINGEDRASRVRRGTWKVGMDGEAKEYGWARTVFWLPVFKKGYQKERCSSLRRIGGWRRKKREEKGAIEQEENEREGGQ